MTGWILAALAPLALGPALALAAANGSGGVAAGQTLLMMSSARSAGLAAPVAAGGGLTGMVANPAALAGQDRRAVSGSYADMMAGARMGQLEAAVPAGPAVLGLQFGMFQAGEVDVVEDWGVTQRVQTQSDYLVAGTAAVRMWAGLEAGVTAKWFSSELVERYRANTTALDLGLRYGWMEGLFTVGAAVSNIGGRLRYSDTASRLPLVGAAGAAWCAYSDRGSSVLFLGEVTRQESLAAVSTAGVEATINGALVLRGGLIINDGLAGGCAGIGLRFRTYGFDFARVMQDALPVANRVSLEVGF